MGADAIIVLAVLGLVLGLLIVTRLPPDAVLMGGLTLLMVCPLQRNGTWSMGVLDPAQALAGFSNPGVIVVGVLYVVVAGLRATGAVDWVGERVLGRAAGERSALVRLTAATGLTSAFLNNTPVVAALVPVVTAFSRRSGIAASKLLMPLSFAAVLGGTCTLIGTSTNLVVAGLVSAQTDLPALRMFDITWVGLPTAAAGAAFMIALAPRLLAGRTAAGAALSDAREYTAEMLVPPGSPLAGRTIEQAGLRNLPGCFLVEIERAGDVLVAVGPQQVLRENDRLVFAGVVESIKDLQSLRGLAPATDQVFKLDSPRHRRRLFEAVVSDACPIVGRSIKQGRFRTVYDAAVLAVARHGRRIGGRIGDIVLRAGDLLLVEAHASFEAHLRDSRDFLLIRPLEDSAPRRRERSAAAVAILALMVAAVALGWLEMLHAALLAAGAMIATRCCSIGDARRAVDWSVLIVIAASLGLGAALDRSGAAHALAQGGLAAVGERPWLALAAVYLLTALINEFISNNAAVALMFPIALAAAQQLGVSFQPFVFAIMMAGSNSFATPIGYQTHLMVYGPGGYTFADFLRLGVPMNVITAAVALLLTPLIWPF